MDKKPLVSIVTPSYNQGQFLEETILSVLNQDYPNIEYMIIDGGSTDNSVEIIRKYEERLAYWVSEPDGGQADAINKGWARSKGEYIGWINSDDLLLPGAVTTAVEYLIQLPDIGLVYGDLLFIDENGNKIGDWRCSDFDSYELIRTAGYFSQQGNIIRKSIYDQIGMLDASLYNLMDLDYWYRISLASKIEHINKYLACFRHHPASKMFNKNFRGDEEIQIIYRKIFSLDNLPVELRKKKNESYSNAYLFAAKISYYAGRKKKAKSLIQKSIHQFPAICFSKKFLSLLSHIVIGELLGGTNSSLYKSMRNIYRTIRI